MPLGENICSVTANRSVPPRLEAFSERLIMTLGQRVADAVGRRQLWVKVRAAFVNQPAQPVPCEGPKTVTPADAFAGDFPAEPRIAGIGAIGARGECAN